MDFLNFIFIDFNTIYGVDVIKQDNNLICKLFNTIIFYISYHKNIGYIITIDDKQFNSFDKEEIRKYLIYFIETKKIEYYKSVYSKKKYSFLKKCVNCFYSNKYQYSMFNLGIIL